MDLFVVHHIRQNEGTRNAYPDAWINIWALEADVTRRAGDALILLFGGIARGVKALAVFAFSAFKGAPAAIPARVATRSEHVELAARNDDRAAA